MAKSWAIVLMLWSAILYGHSQQPQSGGANGSTDKQSLNADVRIVQVPAKDAYDKTAIGISAVLGVIGIVGVIFGFRTLSYLRGEAEEMQQQRRLMAKTLVAIKRQALSMRRQTTLLRKSAEAAEASAVFARDQMRADKERERGRLVIRSIDAPEIFPPENILDGHRPMKVRAFVENLGRSKAFSVRAYGVVNVLSNPKGGDHEDGFAQHFPQIIDEGNERHVLNLGGFGREFEDIGSSSDLIVIPDELAQRIRKGEAFVQASGLLTYQDVFGGDHATPFRFVWRSMGDDAGEAWLTRSSWIDCSPPST